MPNRICPECDTRSKGEICPKCGTRTLLDVPSESGLDPLVGKVLEGRYRVEAVIGKGGMGAVYQATQIAMNKIVAVKLIKPELASHVEAAKRFHREAKASSLLSHPHSIRVFDFGQTKDRELFMVMEFLDGTPLSRRIREVGRLPMVRVAKIGAEIAQALVEAHGRSLIHRDLKPDNVLLLGLPGDPDFVKVLDFGIAKFMSGSSGDSAVTRTGAVIGTPHYMAPEQAKAARHMTTAVDVYALGVMIYEMLTGTLPFNGETPVEILMAHVTEPAPELPRDVQVSDDARDLVRRMLAKVATERPQACEVQQALEEIRQREQAFAFMARSGETTPRNAPGASAQAPARVEPEPERIPAPAFESSTENFRSPRESYTAESAPIATPTPFAPELSDVWPAAPMGTSRTRKLLAAGVGMLVVAGMIMAWQLLGGADTDAKHDDAPDVSLQQAVAERPVTSNAVATPPPSHEVDAAASDANASEATSPPDVAPPPAPATISVKITSSPPGAEVFEGRARLGVTPLERVLPAGSPAQTWRFERVGFREKIVRVEVGTGAPVEVTLEPVEAQKPEEPKAVRAPSEPRKQPAAAAPGGRANPVKPSAKATSKPKSDPGTDFDSPF